MEDHGAVSTATLTITDAQRQQYRDEGYTVLPRVIPDRYAEMDRPGTDVLGISHRHKR
jgi:hypothetical protein